MALQRVNRGRPSGSTNIVLEVEILNEAAILTENWCLFELGSCLDQPISTLRWLAQRKLIKNNFFCNPCNRHFTLNAYKRTVDGYCWYCKECKRRRSVRDGSFFTRSKLSFKQIILFIYCWSRDMQLKDIQHEARLSSVNHTLVDWGNFCRDVCEVEIETNPNVVGGINNDGTAIVVEIDESKFFHRKYHRGQWRPGHWVFGGIERGSGKCFLVELPDRTAETLQDMILRYILPGTHIVSDDWASYGGIENLQNGIYSHAVVVHERNFVDPLDDEVHTQNVENLWMRVKRKLRRQFGTSEDLFTSYLHEFIWRQRFKNFPLFSAFISCISRQYPA
ncbi:male abnormal protein mab-31 [Hydra vulgaris]|uniref:male abnormal protein mab-31 n=1 Tax=Hydra vulgaris TaxID=6087 RepID=UPI001F5F5843|nr:uncharacterized protein LOC124817259 [Hydra vulgaris]